MGVCYRKIINTYNLPLIFNLFFLKLIVNSLRNTLTFILECQMAPLNKRNLRFKDSLTIGEFERPTNKENSTSKEN